MIANLWRLFQYTRPNLGRLIAGTLCLLGATGCQMLLPFLITVVTDQVLDARDLRMLNLISIGVVIMFIVRGLLVYGNQYLMEYVGQRLVVDLRDSLYRAMMRLRGLSYFEKNRTGNLMSYYTNDINALQSVITGAGLDCIRESLILVFSIVYMLVLDWKLSLLLFITVPLIAWAVRNIGRKIKKASHQVLGQMQEFTGILQETISGVRQVKSFVREDHEINRFEAQTLRNFQAIMKATRYGAFLTPMVEFLSTVGVVAIIWYGSRAVIDGDLTKGQLLAFMALAVNLSNPIKRISRAYSKMQQADAASERLFGAMDFEPEVKDAPDAQIMPAIKGEVRFDHISFAYRPKDPPAIQDLDFTVQQGQLIALVGASGAGKSTLANLLMRFYDISSGAILIDGVDIRSVTQASLREQIGVVPQETLLFTGSIADNIRYGRLEANDEEVEAAARAAHVTEFAEKFPDGFGTMVGERGASLSGGQRQRVSIARAILKDPRILILDEATSALDTESEHLVQAALDQLLPGRTSFVIAHRLSTIVKADVILVLDHGRLVEHGRHQELLEKNGLYAKLYHTQFRQD